MAGWTLELYNGFDGNVYAKQGLSGTLPDQQAGFGTRRFATPGLQNGPRDGIVLADPSRRLVQFLSYEGTFRASDGLAVGLTSVGIKPFERPSTGVGLSLQLIGTGSSAADFTWADPRTASPNAINDGQRFIARTVLPGPRPGAAPGAPPGSAVTSVGRALTHLCLRRAFRPFGQAGPTDRASATRWRMRRSSTSRSSECTAAGSWAGAACGRRPAGRPRPDACAAGHGSRASPDSAGGGNTVAFGGIVNGRPLRPGGYELTASVADGARRMVFRIRG